ncbi:MAG: transcription termination/antitermination protein NusG [Clostridia bacterium]|nr:transcription termination/antitermination protein NusG [Clostridia bacterium]
MSEPKWYVIHTYSGYENKVADSIEKIVENRGLQDYIYEVKIPTETVTEVKDGKERQYERKVFPGYVLVKMIVTDESWFIVRNIRGVTGFVGASSTAPVPLSDKEVEALGVENNEVIVNFKVGDNVNIIDGPLEGFVGVVDEIEPDKNYVKVILSMFGRETPVELELTQIELV